MPKFRCNNCNQKMDVKGEHVGRKVKCPACGQPVRVPEQDEPPGHMTYRDKLIKALRDEQALKEQQAQQEPEPPEPGDPLKGI